MARPRTAAVNDEAETSFEQAMAELEGIVTHLEDGQLPLDQLVTNYERGTALLVICQSRLDTAQERISLIAKGENGEPTLEPFVGGETSAGAPGAARAAAVNPAARKASTPLLTQSDDDIRLF